MTSIARRRPTVFGRDEELAAGDRYLDALRNGSASLLLEGEPGIGKTTVWSEICARGTARGQLVLMSRPVRSETELPFAGLTDLVGERATTLLPRLPRPQRRALEVALLLVEPDPSEAVGALAASAGFLSILSLLSTESPVIVAIDDLQYLDRPSLRILSFATRRLGMLRVGLLGTIRVPSPLDPAVPLLDLGVAADQVRLGPLTTASLYHVIDEQLGLSLPRPTFDHDRWRLGWQSDHRAGARASARRWQAILHRHVAASDPQDLNRLVDRRVEALPPLTRRALLRCAALARPTADLVSVRDLAPALDDDFVAIEDDGRTGSRIRCSPARSTRPRRRSVAPTSTVGRRGASPIPTSERSTRRSPRPGAMADWRFGSMRWRNGHGGGVPLRWPPSSRNAPSREHRSTIARRSWQGGYARPSTTSAPGTSSAQPRSRTMSCRTRPTPRSGPAPTGSPPRSPTARASGARQPHA